MERDLIEIRNFYEKYKKLSLEELENLVSNSNDEEERLFFGMLLNYFLKTNLKKVLENERW